jgi:hypothetical protein
MNAGFEPVGSSGVVNVSETVDENSYTFRRLNEAEFEIEKESFANTYNHDTFLALYCSPSCPLPNRLVSNENKKTGAY